MKLFLLFLLLLTASAQAQTGLKFDKRFVESEDKWVAFRPDKDGTYSYGFIYIDEQAGLTLQVGSRFTIAKDGTYVPVPQVIDSTNIKVRLAPNQVQVAWLPPAALAPLHLKTVPDWLRFYKTDTASINRLYRWGFLYNSWDESARALPYLLRAQRLDPKFRGLAAELAYTYNALQQYDQAIPVALSGLEATPSDCYLVKELSYAQLQSGQLAQAAATSRQGLARCTNKAMKSEIAFNMAGRYHQVKDKKNFDYWARETRKWATKGDQYETNLAKLEASFGQ